MSAYRQAFFHAWAHWLARRYRAVLAGAGVLTVLAVGAATQLEIRAGRVDLLGDSHPVARDWLAFGRDFGSPNGIVLLLEGGTPARRRLAVDVLAEVLHTREHDLYRNVLYRVDAEFQQAFGAYYLDTDVLETAQTALETLEGDTTPTWSAAFEILEARLRTMGTAELDDPNNAAALESVVQIAERWAGIVETGEMPAEPFAFPLASPLAAHTGLTPVDAQGYLISNDGARHLMLIDPRSEREDAAAFLLPFMTTLYDAIETAEVNVPEVAVRLTGMSAYAYQDLEVITSEIPWLTALSLVGLVLIFRAAFPSLRPALYAGGALLLAIVWTLGLTALTVGHLTLLSSVFGLILIGLGIDYGIYLVVLYQEARGHHEPAEALATAFARGVNGILTGGATTAAAFALCGIADFAAFAQLGTITALGIGCNLLAMLFVLPALLMAGERRAAARGVALTHTDAESGPLERLFGGLGRRLERHQWVGAALGLGLAAWAVPNMGRVPFDYTFLNLQPAGSPFPEAEEILAATTNFAPHFNLLLGADAEEAGRLAAETETLDTVRHSMHVGELVPPPDAERDALVAQVRAAAMQVRPPPPPTGTDLERIDKTLNLIRMRFAAFERASFSIQDKATLQRIRRIVRAVERIRAARENLSRDVWVYRHAAFLDTVSATWLEFAERLDDIAPAPPGLADLPVELRRRFIGSSGRHAVYVIPTDTLWDIEFLLGFNAEVHTVTPEVTGIGILLGELFVQASAAPRQVGTWVGVVILLVLFADYRDPRPVLGACAALALGVVSVVGVMHWLGMEFNPINILAFPLLLGIGIDNSVHVLHRFRAPDQPSFETVFRSTGKAVFLASLTSCVSFGILTLSTHRGLSSFGTVMAIGVFMCYLSAMIVLPCCRGLALRIFGRRAPARDTADTPR